MIALIRSFLSSEHLPKTNGEFTKRAWGIGNTEYRCWPQWIKPSRRQCWHGLARRCKQRVGRVNSPAGPRNSLHPAAIPSHNVQSGLWPGSTRPVGTGSHLDWPTATSSLQSTHYSSQPVFLHIRTVYHFTSRQLCLSTFEAFWSIVTLLQFVYI